MTDLCVYAIKIYNRPDSTDKFMLSNIKELQNSKLSAGRKCILYSNGTSPPTTFCAQKVFIITTIKTAMTPGKHRKEYWKQVCFRNKLYGSSALIILG